MPLRLKNEHHLENRFTTRGDCAPYEISSGEEIQKGDKVLFHGEPGEIEFIVDKVASDPAMDWYLKQHGPGVMVLEPKYFGRAYIGDAENNEDLEFVSRG